MDSNIKTEFFSIDKSKIKNLFIYKLESTSNNISELGGKLKFKLGKMYSNNTFGWNKDNKLLVSDLNIPDIQNLLEELWQDEDIYQSLIHIIPLSGNKDNVSIAEYVVSYINRKYSKELWNFKKEYNKNYSLDKFSLNLEINFRTWELNNEPCISISVNHNIVSNTDLSEYYENENKEIVDMHVVVIPTFTKYNSTGTIVNTYGKLKDHANRLRLATENDLMKKLIDRNVKTNPDQPIAQVKFNKSGKTYDYIMAALKPVIRSDTIFKGGELSGISNILKIKPDIRYKLIMDIYGIIQKSGLFTVNIDNISNNNIFDTLEEEYWQPSIKVGNNTTVQYQPYFIRLLTQHGLYFKNEKFENEKLKVLIINASGLNIDDYMQSLQSKFNALKIDMGIVKTLNKSFDEAIECIGNYNFDILMFIGEYNFNDRLYFNYKSKLLPKNIQSQFLKYDTVKNQLQYSPSNVVLGILGKTGNIPFILNNERYADYIVGIDISREKKKNNSGTRNVAAMTRIYSYDGTMVKYRIISDSVEGETIPEQTLYKIYMDDELKDKEVVFHRDGPFRGNEIEVLDKIANKLNSKFYYIEINKRNTPRLYKCNNGKIENPGIGTYLNVGNNEYIIITSRSKIGTVQPLRVKFYNVDFEKGMKSIYNLLIMDYGSLQPPKLPITTYYSDKISYYALRGILPQDTEGKIPFWF